MMMMVVIWQLSVYKTIFEIERERKRKNYFSFQFITGKKLTNWLVHKFISRRRAKRILLLPLCIS